MKTETCVLWNVFMPKFDEILHLCFKIYTYSMLQVISILWIDFTSWPRLAR